jgi:acyl carrier protein
MTNHDIEERIIKLTADSLGVDVSKVTRDSHFIDDLNADSLDQVELMMAIEAAFSCDIPDEEAGKISTVADAVNYVKQKVAVE